jgi:Na+-translocating ferredoxin:NAD+ oxidoreductase RnfG subunit
VIVDDNDDNIVGTNFIAHSDFIAGATAAPRIVMRSLKRIVETRV